MGIKSFLIILVLSVVVTIGVPLISFSLGQYKLAGGVPFKYAEFSFLGDSINYSTFLLDIIIWFIAIWLIEKFIAILIKH